ncbi:DUF7033 domain-containing protein [Gemmatimonadota bacterium]
MIKVILDCGSFFNPRARYIWDTFFTYYQVEHEYIELDREENNPIPSSVGITIYCGPEHRAGELIISSPTLVLCHEKSSSAMFKNKEMPSAPAFIENAPVLFAPVGGETVLHQHNRIICKADILATAFFFLSAYQEHVCPEDVLDQYGRYPFKASYQAKYSLLEIPVVNLLFELTATWLKELGHTVKRVDFPGSSTFTVVLSHDIDRMLFYSSGRVYKKVRNCLAELIKYRNLKESVNHLLGIFYNPHDTFDRIRNLHRQIGAGDSYFFVFNKQRHPMDPDYFIEDPEMYRILQSLKNSGAELGLHGSFDSLEKGTYLKEYEYAQSIIGKPCLGGRIHYLRFQIQAMFEIFESVGLGYDSSLLFPEAPGFRTGFGLPHLLFDHEHDKAFPTLEIPLNVMDTTLFDKRYLKLSLREADKKIMSLLEIAKSSGLCISILTHNDFYLHSNIMAVRLYRQTLLKAQEQGALLTDCRTIYRWWQSLQ